ncbi:hypothetical protein ACWKSP_07160 [Micromonosporaceae bacterium Da 78-11]
MAGDELTPTESAILVVLMAEAREVLNTELKDQYGLDVRKPQRDKLTALKYVSSRPSGRTTALQLEDRGGVRAQSEFDFRFRGASAGGAALTALLTSLRDRVMRRSGYANLVELFALSDMREQAPTLDLRPRIVATYEALAAEPGEWVSLRRLRPFFADLPKDTLDEALTEISRAGGVSLVPESNQRTLTAADLEAALHLGGQDNHLLAFGV